MSDKKKGSQEKIYGNIQKPPRNAPINSPHSGNLDRTNPTQQLVTSDSRQLTPQIESQTQQSNIPVETSTQNKPTISGTQKNIEQDKNQSLIRDHTLTTHTEHFEISPINNTAKRHLNFDDSLLQPRTPSIPVPPNMNQNLNQNMENLAIGVPNPNANLGANANITNPFAYHPAQNAKIKNVLNWIPIFEGDFDSFVYFSAACQNAKRALPESMDKDLLLALHKKFKGAASDAFSLKLSKYNSVNELLDDMSKAFDPITNISTWVDSMRSIVHAPGEKVFSYAGKFVRLLDSAILASESCHETPANQIRFVTDIEEQCLKHFFANMYKPLRTRIEWKKPETLMQAMNLAQLSERNDFGGLAYKANLKAGLTSEFAENSFKQIAYIRTPRKTNRDDSGEDEEECANELRSRKYEAKNTSFKNREKNTTPYRKEEQGKKQFNNPRNYNQREANKRDNYELQRSNNYNKNEAKFSKRAPKMLDIKFVTCFRCNQKGHYANKCRTDMSREQGNRWDKPRETERAGPPPDSPPNRRGGPFRTYRDDTWDIVDPDKVQNNSQNEDWDEEIRNEKRKANVYNFSCQSKNGESTRYETGTSVGTSENEWKWVAHL